LQFDITHSPGFSKLDVRFEQDEVLFAQPKSMLCMSTGFELTAHIGGAAGPGGVGKGVKSILSGESFATSAYRATKPGQVLSLAPAAIGEVIPLEINENNSFYIARGAYLAHQSTVQLEAKYAGMKGLMTKKGLFLLHASGKGTVFIASFGAIVQQTLAQDELLVVDNEYVLAFSNKLHYELRTAAKSLKDSVMSGEGLVNRYRGPGELYYQTRSRQRTSLIASMLNLST
jgi:uncharacterized protein (TIGR00266 family)